MTVYNTNFGASLLDLATPLPIAPPHVKMVPPQAVIAASGLRKLNGSWGRELLWDITDPNDLKAIYDRTGGDAASSIVGYFQGEDHTPRSSTVPTYSIWLAVLDQPIEGDFLQGPNRGNVKMSVRHMQLVEQLAP